MSLQFLGSGPLAALLMIPFLPQNLISLLYTFSEMAESARQWEVEQPADHQRLVEVMMARDHPAVLTTGQKIIPELQEHLVAGLDLCERHATANGLDGTALLCQELSRRIGAGTLNKFELKERIEELRNVVLKELDRHSFFKLLQENKKYWDSPRLFGDEVWTAFPSARFDIEEAGKCLALERGTAAVFHLMRTMECGLKTIAKPLGIPYAPSWESYINQMSKKIAEKHSTKSVAWKKIQPLFVEILGDLQSVKIAWRNPTMHVTRRYKPDEAEEIFRVVKRFMNRISEKFAEPVKRGQRGKQVT